jgi:hypothetical protein
MDIARISRQRLIDHTRGTQPVFVQSQADFGGRIRLPLSAESTKLVFSKAGGLRTGDMLRRRICGICATRPTLSMDPRTNPANIES